MTRMCHEECLTEPSSQIGHRLEDCKEIPIELLKILNTSFVEIGPANRRTNLVSFDISETVEKIEKKSDCWGVGDLSQLSAFVIRVLLM